MQILLYIWNVKFSTQHKVIFDQYGVLSLSDRCGDIPGHGVLLSFLGHLVEWTLKSSLILFLGMRFADHKTYRRKGYNGQGHQWAKRFRSCKNWSHFSFHRSMMKEATMLNIHFLNYVSFLFPDVWRKKPWYPVPGRNPKIPQSNISFILFFFRTITICHFCCSPFPKGLLQNLEWRVNVACTLGRMQSPLLFEILSVT